MALPLWAWSRNLSEVLKVSEFLVLNEHSSRFLLIRNHYLS
ncbi:hypothetical protein [Rubritalea tangerina]